MYQKDATQMAGVHSGFPFSIADGMSLTDTDQKMGWSQRRYLINIYSYDI